MTAASRALTVGIFLICVSFGFFMFNTILDINELETGKSVFTKITPPLNISQLDQVSSQQALDRTLNKTVDFQKPSDISYNLDFMQSINIAAIMIDGIVKSVYYVPTAFLSLFLPANLIAPITAILGLGLVMLIIYTVVGKNY